LRRWMWVIAGALVLALAASPVLASGVGGQRMRARDGSGLDQLRLQVRDRVCTELGVTPEQFRQAWQRAATQVVDEAQAQGKLTPEQADRIRQQIEQGNPGFRAGRAAAGKGRWAMGIHLQAGRWALDQLAEFLGMTPEDFWSALRGGKSVAQIAQERGKTRQEVVDFLTGKVKARLDEAVATGRITQERADEAMAAFQARLPQVLDYVRDCTGCPGCGGPGARWQRGGQGPRAPQPSQEPQASQGF